MEIVDLDTVVVVHGGDNGSSALHWPHTCVMNTSILEKHWEADVAGRPLKAICTGLQGINIQQDKRYNSLENVAACRELVYYGTLSIVDYLRP